MIKYLIMDVDGTLTDGKVYIGSDGEKIKAFNIKDGYGIHDILIPTGIIPVIITGRESNIVISRCRELGINEIYQGVKDKLSFLLNKFPDLSVIAYIGDDLNDLSSMEAIKKRDGLVGCPADAAKKVISISDFVTPSSGGNGAVREFIEWILHH